MSSSARRGSSERSTNCRRPGRCSTAKPSALGNSALSNFVSMRGLGGPRLLVRLDGQSLNDAFFGFVPWDRAPLDAVDRVEVVRGAREPRGRLRGEAASAGPAEALAKAGTECDLAGDFRGAESHE